MTCYRQIMTLVLASVCGVLLAAPVTAELYVGAASTEITPPEPVAVSGQFGLRISKSVETPLTANALVIQSRQEDKPLDTAIMVSCDIISIPTDVLELVRQQVVAQLPDVDPGKIFVGGTHTHTAPELRLGMWVLPDKGVMHEEQYRQFFVRQVAAAIVKAWQNRSPGSISWGLSHAVVGYNRRAVYANGSARMYGSTTGAEFRGLEGYEDHDVGTLFAWNKSGKLIAAAVNVTCPSQEVESRHTINADFWHPVREQLRAKYGDDVCILGWPGAAGDQSPHLMYRKAADERMRQLRQLSRLEEIARRIVVAVNDAYEVVQHDRHADGPVVHRVESLQLPMRLVTPAEYQEAKTAVEEAAAQIAADPQAESRLHRRMKWYERTVARYEQQQSDPHPMLTTEVHVVRIGDAVICTNQFELFTDYGIRIKARSRAEQTFVIQLVGPGTYLPTEKAVRGGHYSAVVHSNLVGPEGGQKLVDRTVDLINSMWEESSE